MVAMNKSRDLQKELDNDSQTSLSAKSIHSHDREFCNRSLKVSVQNQHYNQGNSWSSDNIPIPLIEDRIGLNAEERQREREMRTVGRDRKLGSQRANRTDRHTTQRERADKHTHTRQQNESDSYSEGDSERQRSRSRSNEHRQSVIVRPTHTNTQTLHHRAKCTTTTDV